MSISVVFADIHINTTKYPAYEEDKIRLIIKAVKESAASNVVLAGDIFDKAKPSLQDISLFYDMVHSFPEDVTVDILAGNHDHSVFEYLPQTTFTYHSEITKRDNVTFVPWTKLNELAAKHYDSSGVCYSHARCTVPPYIVEEVEISKFSQGFKLTVLGDIHQPYEPYKNVVYTSSPVPIHFKLYQKNSTGYLVVDEEACTYTRHFINDIAKVKIMATALKLGDTINALKKRPAGNLYKVVVEDYPEKLLGIQKWATTSIRIEPKVLLRQDDVADKVKAVLDQSLTIEDVLYNFLGETYREYTIDLENELRRSINA